MQYIVSSGSHMRQIDALSINQAAELFICLLAEEDPNIKLGKITSVNNKIFCTNSLIDGLSTPRFRLV